MNGDNDWIASAGRCEPVNRFVPKHAIVRGIGPTFSCSPSILPTRSILASFRFQGSSASTGTSTSPITHAVTSTIVTVYPCSAVVDSKICSTVKRPILSLYFHSTVSERSGYSSLYSFVLVVIVIVIASRCRVRQVTRRSHIPQHHRRPIVAERPNAATLIHALIWLSERTHDCASFLSARGCAAGRAVCSRALVRRVVIPHHAKDTHTHNSA